MYILGESCSSCYTEYRKIELAIFGFFYDFIINLQVAAKTHQRGRIFSALGSLELFNSTTLPLTLAARPSIPRNLSQGYPRRRSRARRRRGGAGVGKQMTQMLDSIHLGSVGHGFEGRDCSGERARRSPTTAAAGNVAPANQ
jgi:hypothetical protein